MSEKIELGLQPWLDVSSDELGYTSSGLRSSITRYNEGEKHQQQFNVLDIDARNGEPGPTIITSTPFNYRIDPLMRRRMTQLATHSKARVLASELPGVTIDLDDPENTGGDYQTIPQTLMALCGNFDLLAAKQLEAIDSVANFADGDQIQLVGHSLSAYSMVAMARVIAQGKLYDKQLAITRMDLIEPVNAYGNHTIDHQIKMFFQLAQLEDQRRQLYLQENVRIGHGDIGAYEKISPFTAKADKYVKRRQVLAIYASGAGLRKGMTPALDQAFEASPDLRNTQFVLSRGIDSTASFENDLLSAAYAIRNSGGKAETIAFVAEKGDSTPMGHSVLDSLARMASYAVTRKDSMNQFNQ